MRKLILISAIVLSATVANADQATRGLVLASAPNSSPTKPAVQPAPQTAVAANQAPAVDPSKPVKLMTVIEQLKALGELKSQPAAAPQTQTQAPAAVAPAASAPTATAPAAVPAPATAPVVTAPVEAKPATASTEAKPATAATPKKKAGTTEARIRRELRRHGIY